MYNGTRLEFIFVVRNTINDYSPKIVTNWLWLRHFTFSYLSDLHLNPLARRSVKCVTYPYDNNALCDRQLMRLD